MSNLFKTISLILFSFLMITACGEEEPVTMEPDPEEMTDECADVDASYKDDIKGILDNSCAISGCHVEGFSSGDWTTYENVKDAATSIKNRAVTQKNMPPASSDAPKLTDDQIKLLNCWIEGGAQDN